MDFLERELIDGYGLPDDFTWEQRDYFSSLYRERGRFSTKGEFFKNEDLADTYEKIAAGGRDAFYKGEIAHAISRHVQRLGGLLSTDVFANHTSVGIAPISVNYSGAVVSEIPPNTTVR